MLYMFVTIEEGNGAKPVEYAAKIAATTAVTVLSSRLVYSFDEKRGLSWS